MPHPINWLLLLSIWIQVSKMLLLFWHVVVTQWRHPKVGRNHLCGSAYRLYCLVLLSMSQQCRGCRARLLQASNIRRIDPCHISATSCSSIMINSRQQIHSTGFWSLSIFLCIYLSMFRTIFLSGIYLCIWSPSGIEIRIRYIIRYRFERSHTQPCALAMYPQPSDCLDNVWPDPVW